MNRAKRLSLSSFFLCVALLFAMAAFLTAPARYASAVREGISLWAVSVLPAVFPFLFLCPLLTATPLFRWLAKVLSPITQILFRVSGEGGCLAFVSALSGYPVGARLLFELTERKKLPRGEVFRLACLCTASGPAFLVGVVGSAMFASAKLGYLLFLSHLLGVYTVSFIVRLFTRNYTPSAPSLPPKTTADLYQTTLNAVLSILCVGGLIALFSAFGLMIQDCGIISLLSSPFPDPAQAEGVLLGLLEMTGGCARLANYPCRSSVALASFLITFGGLCVLLQQLAFLKRTGVKTLPFLGIKFAQAVLSALICYVLFPIV